MVVGLHIVSGIYGPQIWDTPVFATLGISDYSYLLPTFLHIDVLEYKHMFLFTGVIGLGFNILSASANVIAARRKKNQDLFPALAGLIPFFVSTATSYTFAYLNPSIVSDFCIPFMFYIGTCLAYSVGLIITAHVTHAAFPYFTPYFLLSPMVLGVIFNSKVGPSEAIAIVYLSLGLAVGVYGSFIVDVIGDITSHLDIWCLTIKHPQVKKD